MFKWFRRGASPAPEQAPAAEAAQREAEKIQHAVEATRSTWFGRVSQLFQRAELTEELWDELEEALLSADVGVETTERLLAELRSAVEVMPDPTPQKAREALKDAMLAILDAVEPPSDARSARPWVVLVVGVNGSGKTTTIGKLAYRLKGEGETVLLGAADTFRAAAIEQLQRWGERTGIEVIAHQAGADPGAVAFDTVQAARNRGADVVLIDTAGRLHTKVNLMEELKKVRRVIQRVDPGAPHEVLLVLDATTGQNGLIQARHFTEAVDVSGVILTKLDGTAKGGIVLSIASDLGLPVSYIGTGEAKDDIALFDPVAFVEGLLS